MHMNSPKLSSAACNGDTSRKRAYPVAGCCGPLTLYRSLTSHLGKHIIILRQHRPASTTPPSRGCLPAPSLSTRLTTRRHAHGNTLQDTASAARHPCLAISSRVSVTDSQLPGIQDWQFAPRYPWLAVSSRVSMTGSQQPAVRDWPVAAWYQCLAVIRDCQSAARCPLTEIGSQVSVTGNQQTNIRAWRT